MEKRSAAPIPSTTRFALLGFTVEQYTDRFGSGEARWEISTGDAVMIFTSPCLALATIWEARTGGAA